MANIEELKKYIKRLNKIVQTAEFSILGSSVVRRNKIDDTIVCILAVLPDSFKKAMKKRMPIDMYPSVSSFNRLSKIIKKPLFIFNNFYIFKANEAIALIQTINKNIERDVEKLEEAQ